MDWHKFCIDPEYRKKIGEARNDGDIASGRPRAGAPPHAHTLEGARIRAQAHAREIEVGGDRRRNLQVIAANWRARRVRIAHARIKQGMREISAANIECMGAGERGAAKKLLKACRLIEAAVRKMEKRK